MIDLDKIILDRSPAQKNARLNAMRAELFGLGYSVVPTEWLNSISKESSNEQTKTPRPHQGKASRASISQARV